MAADDFFSRWSKSKPATGSSPERAKPPTVSEDSSSSAAPAAPAEPALPPTLDEVAKLTHESDFSRFVGRDVDDTVKRSALKKLFSDPHFNLMDGLDIYIDDYNKFTPLTPAVLATLNHAKDLLNPQGRQSAELASRHDEEELLPASAAAEEGGGADDVSPGAEQQAALAEGGSDKSQDQDSAPLVSDDQRASSDDVDDKPISQGGS